MTKPKSNAGQIKRWRNHHIVGARHGLVRYDEKDELDNFPADYPRRKQILDITNQPAQILATYQNGQTGLWYQVMDVAKKDGNYLESSGSTMFVYFLVKAASKRYIDQKYTRIARKGYDGILTHFVKTQPTGIVTITDACSRAGLGGMLYRDGTYEHYCKEVKRDNDPKSVSPFILLALEFEEIK